jgi:hypothetical protein
VQRTSKLEQHRHRHAVLSSQSVKAGGWTSSAITALRAGILAYLDFHRDDVYPDSVTLMRFTGSTRLMHSSSTHRVKRERAHSRRGGHVLVRSR